MLDAPFRAQIAGHEVAARIKPITHNVKMKLEDVIGSARQRSGRPIDAGSAMGFVLIGCLDVLYVDGREVTPTELGTLEDYYDEELGMDMQELLLGEIVRHPRNKILLRKYGNVFSEFQNNDRREGDTAEVIELQQEENPTQYPAPQTT